VEPIETLVFTRQIGALPTDEEYAGFQSRLAANPTPKQVSQLAGVVKEEFGSEEADV